ncbi:hypothetical protein [Nostoc sp.]|uniref:hypothetical protein n=1 Tax=Nostoc sp. TaxID=1180 RepID=UPI002FF94D68
MLSAIAHSLQNDLRLHTPVPQDIVDRMTGLLKTDFSTTNRCGSGDNFRRRLGGEIPEMKVLLDTNIILDVFRE